MKKILFLFIAVSFLASCGDGYTYVNIDTEYGTMKVRLYNTTPLHKENFIKLTKEGYYDGLLFHRVIKNFMAQGGDPNSRDAADSANLGSGGPGYQIPAEIGAPHFKGCLAAARTGGSANPEKKSSGSQFYIVQGNGQSAKSIEISEKNKGIKYSAEQRAKYIERGGAINLDQDYTVFGEVIEGLDIIDKICNVEKNERDRPIKDIAMKISMAPNK